MASMTPTYTDRTTIALPRTRTGGPRRTRPTRAERLNEFMGSRTSGSHMPIDTDLHWDWRNPLNIIPAFVLLVALVAIIECLAMTLL